MPRTLYSSNKHLNIIEEKMKRCKKCILPKNYPGITFSHLGICNYCSTFHKKQYLGPKILKQQINSFLETKKNRNQDYDCLIRVSGGRDSSYLLYYFVKVLKFKVLAYSVDNGYIPEQTKLNLHHMTQKLNVNLVIEENKHLKRCLKHHLSAWLSKPSAAMIGLLCVGCKLGIDLGPIKTARKHRIPVIISGGTPFEDLGYKFNLLRNKPTSSSNSSAILGYLLQVASNPKWIMNANCFLTQFKEYYYHYWLKTFRPGKKKDLLIFSPFWTHIRWEEKRVISTIENELDWKKNPNLESRMRGDCDIASLKKYLYKKTLGFNDVADSLSSLIREGQIPREEAIQRLYKEEEIPEEPIRDLFDRIGLDFSELRTALSKVSYKEIGFEIS